MNIGYTNTLMEELDGRIPGFEEWTHLSLRDIQYLHGVGTLIGSGGVKNLGKRARLKDNIESKKLIWKKLIDINIH